MLIKLCFWGPAVTFSALITLYPPPSASAQTSCPDRRRPEQIDAGIDRLIQQMSPAERIAQLQDRAPAIPRLGLPAYNWWNEGLHGIARNGYATVFPQAIGLAATWDSDLLTAVGDTVSTEARAKFNPHAHTDSERYAGLTVWSPNINIFRDPRWGRGQETYGEDPFLTGSLGIQFVRGVQGSASFYLKADATPKHFVAHSGPEAGRDSFHANASPHDLADTYLPAFHAVLTEAHAAALMCSYNAIDDVPSCANTLLRQRVRDTWNFKGYIVSDCDAVGNLTAYQHYTATAAAAAAAALNAGVDLDCGTSYLPLRQALAQGLVTEQTIDRSLHRLLLARIRLGMMDDAECSAYNAIAASENDTPAHRALALRAARESIVLLKNDGVLPLRSAGQRIAVVGPNADSLDILEANYHGAASHPVTLLEGITQEYPATLYAEGSLAAAGLPAPVPRTALRTGAGPKARNGLNAEYFGRASFDGEPLVKTVVPTVDLDLDRTGPAPRVPAAQYAARWTGVLVPPAAGDYVLQVRMVRCWDCTVHDRYRLYVDGEVVLDNDGSKPEPNGFTLHAAAAAPHAIRLELLHTGADEGIALTWEPPAEALLAEAEAIASRAGVIIACVGLTPGLEGEALQLKLDGFDGGDRTSLDLPAAQRTLLARLSKLHKPIIVVLTSGSAVALDAAPYNALLEAWYPGEEGGTALAKVLTGASSPSGRLPVTFYRSVADLPSFSDYNMEHRTYRYFTGPVLYPFGFGLGYSHFRYGPVHLSNRTVAAGATITAKVTLENEGNTAAGEVAELYLVPPPLPGSPRLALAGFKRIELQPGQSSELTFTLGPSQLSFVDPAGRRAVRAGIYRVFAGGAQPTAAELADPRAGTSFEIAGEVPDDF
jgi:beta-glucosidase